LPRTTSNTDGPAGPGAGARKAQPRPRIAAIVPVYNEHRTLAEVVELLQQSSLVDEILVVSDGSTDRTVEVARALGVRAIHLKQNQGKGTALALGVAHTTAPILLFVDGDILNLPPDFVDRLVQPVLRGTVEMNVALRSLGRLISYLHGRFGPLLSGIRCLRREIFEAVPDEHLRGYRVETALNWYCHQLGCRYGTIVLHGTRHIRKEAKRGFWRGARARWAMYASVFAAHMYLRRERPPLRLLGMARASLELDLEYINF
jgi:polyisoprenyl-phosphate glycosyltransferase